MASHPSTVLMTTFQHLHLRDESQNFLHISLSWLRHLGWYFPGPPTKRTFWSSHIGWSHCGPRRCGPHTIVTYLGRSDNWRFSVIYAPHVSRIFLNLFTQREILHRIMKLFLPPPHPTPFYPHPTPPHPLLPRQEIETENDDLDIAQRTISSRIFSTRTSPTRVHPMRTVLFGLVYEPCQLITQMKGDFFLT